MITGAITALITPFADGAIDEQAFRELIRWQLAEGIDGLVPCGSTGESATMSFEEHERAIDICVEEVAGRVPVIAGTGSNSTSEAIRLTRHAKAAGADAALLITPYYNKPTQKGLIAHFTAVAEACDIPILLYNVPGRTGVNISSATVIELAKLPNIVGIKEASGDLIKVMEIVRSTENFAVLSGEDALNLPILCCGGSGAISVTSNVMPAKMTALMHAWFEGNPDLARKLHFELLDLHASMFIETNPIPVKTALHLMGKCREEFKLPLCSMEPANRSSLTATLRAYGLVA